MSHTRGPWRVSDSDHEELADEFYHFISAGDGLCADEYEGFEIAGCMSIEDARVLAAASDLLDALRYVEHALPKAMGFHRELEVIRAAIAKATSESCAT